MDSHLIPLSPIRQAIIAEALTWINTPYCHRQRCKQAGADCIGFPLGVCINLGLLPENVEIPYYSVQWHMHQQHELLIETAIKMGCIEKEFDNVLPGDLIFFKIGFVCSHTGILLPDNEFAHAVCPLPSMVVKRPFDGLWKKKLAKRFFSLPNVLD